MPQMTVREAIEALSKCDPDALVETHVEEQDVLAMVTHIGPSYDDKVMISTEPYDEDGCDE